MYLKQDKRFVLPSSVSGLPSNEITSENDFDTQGTSITNYCLGCLNSSGKNTVNTNSSSLIYNTGYLTPSRSSTYSIGTYGLYFTPNNNSSCAYIDVSSITNKSWVASYFFRFSSTVGKGSTSNNGVVASICDDSYRLSLELDHDSREIVFYSDKQSKSITTGTTLSVGTLYGIVISYEYASSPSSRYINIYIYDCSDSSNYSLVFSKALTYTAYFSYTNPTRLAICYGTGADRASVYTNYVLDGMIQNIAIFGNIKVTEDTFAKYILQTRPLYYSISTSYGATIYSAATVGGQSTPKFELSNIIANEPNIGEYLKIKYVGQVARHTSGKVMDLTSSNSGAVLEVGSSYCDVACTQSNYLYFKISDATTTYADSGLSTPYDSISISLEHENVSIKPYETPREHKGTLVIDGKTIDSAAREGNDVPEIYIDGKLAFSKKCIVTVNPNSNYTNGSSLLKLYLLKYADGTAVESIHQIYCFPAKFIALGANSADTNNTFTAYYGETWRICKASDESAYLDFKIKKDTIIHGTSISGGSIIDPCGSTGLRSEITCISGNTGASTTCSSTSNKNYITPGA